jgi:polyisoprenoid-binding protein YceI
MLAGLGHNPKMIIRELKGNIQADPDSLQNASVEVEIPASSLMVDEEISAKDRQEIQKIMSDEVLEVSRYPVIQFRSKSISVEKVFEGRYRVKIAGDLSLHGMTRPHSFETQVLYSEDQLRAQGDFVIKQTDFGLKLVTAMAGALKVKDELKCSFDVVSYPDGTE